MMSIFFACIPHKFITNYNLTNNEVEPATKQSLQGQFQLLQLPHPKRKHRQSPSRPTYRTLTAKRPQAEALRVQQQQQNLTIGHTHRSNIEKIGTFPLSCHFAERTEERREQRINWFFDCRCRGTYLERGRTIEIGDSVHEEKADGRAKYRKRAETGIRALPRWCVTRIS
jgi:hypothetical protein